MSSTERSVLLVGEGGPVCAWLTALSGPGAAGLGLRIAGLWPQPSPAAALPDGVTVHSDLDAAMADAPDIVIDCTSAVTRLSVTAEFVRRGMNVLCEPLLAPDEKAAARLVALSGRSPGWLAVCQRGRFTPGLRRARALVEAGTLGPLRSLHAVVRLADGDGPPRGARHRTLRLTAPEAFDVARYLAGADASKAACREHATAGEAHARFHMGEDTPFVFAGTVGASPPATPPHGVWELGFDGGTARVDEAGRLTARRAGDGSELAPADLPQADAATGPLAPLATLVAAIGGGPRPETRARDNARSLAMVFAAMRSAEAGGRPENVWDLALAGDAGDGDPVAVFTGRDR